MRQLINTFTVILSLSVLINSLVVGQQLQPQRDRLKVNLSLQKEIDHSIVLGLKWLYTEQEENGSWQNHPAITALVVSAFLRAHPNISHLDSNLTAAFHYLKTCIKPDGSIFTDNMPNYNTAICLMAFKDAQNPEFKEIILNAERYLMRLQIDEEEGYTPDSLFYGGVGYGGDERPDLSNLQWAIEAFSEREQLQVEQVLSEEEKVHDSEKELFYNKALVFLAKCQNLKQVNKMEYAVDDGGFMYEPGISKAGGSKSYGSMTYAGLKSMIYAKVDKTDKRVQAAYNWILGNFTVETTPFMGNQGLFYYYMTMAKALNAYGAEVIMGSTGQDYKWREELASQLVKIQNEEGWWQNENNRWWENNKVLVTAYCLLSLEEIML